VSNSLGESFPKLTFGQVIQRQGKELGQWAS
jgi:hypothetical protein